jgi:SAM-dependent methyltransferase
MSEKVLNLGCGDKHLAGAVNVDSRESVKPDVLHDLTQFPWPFDDSSFDRVEMIDVIEHLPDTIRTMEEIHRVARKGAIVHLATPHFTSNNAYTDPTHLHRFGYFTFDHFTGNALYVQYSGVRYAYRDRKIIFLPARTNALIRRVANRWPVFYETRLCWLWPAWFLAIELKVVK